jgi:hypothetical protein
MALHPSQVSSSIAKTGARSSLGGVLGGLAQGVLGGIFNLFGQKKRRRQEIENFEMQRKHNMELANFNFDKSVEMWNMQNAYNDPTAQMRRLKNAGLNPHLVYGEGSVSGNTTSNAPQMEATPASTANIPAVDPSMALQQFQNTALREINLKIANEEFRKRQSEADLSSVRSVVAQRNLSDKEQAAWWSDRIINGEWSPSPNMKSEFAKVNKQVSDAEMSKMRVNMAQLDIAIKDLIRKGKIDENKIKQYYGWLAGQKIDPRGSEWFREVKKYLSQKGISIGDVIDSLKIFKKSQ